jgi:type IV secretory pathway protease TraF
VRGGEATLGALAVTRDAHYVDADGRDECPVWTVPPNEYFLVGDNAAVSTDSRVFGTVGPAEILGRVAGVWRR